MSRKYRVEQYFTTGWGVVDEKAIKLTKDELSKIEYYLLGETDPIVMDILEKIGNLDDLCECGGQTN